MMHSLHRVFRPVAAASIVSALLLTLPLTAHAVLGGDSASVSADRSALGAAVSASTATASAYTTASSALYTMQTITTDSGTTIHEYLNSAGTVFAVAWAGQFVPDLRQLFGSYFTPFSDGVASAASAAIAASMPIGRQPLETVQNDLVVQSGGSMRHHTGIAYLKSLLPAGFTADDIR